MYLVMKIVVMNILFCDEERVYFEKENYADFTDPENWDVITPNVALTRANSKGIYNAYLENQFFN